ncbi:MAG: Rab family GTPase [Candidatus Hermodarchaeota archaeon]
MAEPTLKIMIIGSNMVGKTTLIQQYIEKRFQPRYLVTIGVEFKTKILELDGKPIKLLLTDTAGQEKFANLRKTYYAGASACIVVYDITDRNTFEAVDKWLAEFRSVVDSEIPLTLIGNKIDLAHERKVTAVEGSKKAKEMGAIFFETSAKLGTMSIDRAFEDLARRRLQMQ